MEVFCIGIIFCHFVQQKIKWIIRRSSQQNNIQMLCMLMNEITNLLHQYSFYSPKSFKSKGYGSIYQNDEFQFIVCTPAQQNSKDTKKATQTQTARCWLGLAIFQLSHRRKIHGEKCESKIMHKHKVLQDKYSGNIPIKQQLQACIHPKAS